MFVQSNLSVAHVYKKSAIILLVLMAAQTFLIRCAKHTKCIAHYIWCANGTPSVLRNWCDIATHFFLQCSV